MTEAAYPPHWQEGLLYCRAGFETEAVAEVQHWAQQQDLAITTQLGHGFVRVQPQQSTAREKLLQWNTNLLWFARQWLLASAPIVLPNARDRLTPLLESCSQTAVQAIFLETADTNEAKMLSRFCRHFAPILTQALMEKGVYQPQNSQLPRLHLFWHDAQTVQIGYTLPTHSSPWPMGIPRLKFPAHAPSRSTLKLAEAFSSLLTEREQHHCLQAGMHAVDLGACPGGWTYQLVQRGIYTLGVDNGRLHPSLLATGLAKHLAADGFRYRPPKAVDWLVCDMVEQPHRIVELIAHWFIQGWCRYSVFNLKLPMKQRWQHLQQCLQQLDSQLGRAGIKYQLRGKQLYHDREEVTLWLRRLDSGKNRPKPVYPNAPKPTTKARKRRT